MPVKKSHCSTLDEFQDICSYIYGDVMEFISNEQTEWHFIRCDFRPINTWTVTFYNDNYLPRATQSLSLTVKVNNEMLIEILPYYHTF